MILYFMVEADIHLRPLHTSLLDIYKVFEPLVCCLKGISVHPYTITPAKLAQDLGSLGHLCRVKMIPFIMVEADIHLRSLHTSILVIVILATVMGSQRAARSCSGITAADNAALVSFQESHNLVDEFPKR
jgi:hypothetical protein